MTAMPPAALGAGDQTAVDPAITRLLAGIRAADKGQLAVSEEDGRFLRVLVGATNARTVINKKNDMLDFLAAIEQHPMAINTTVSPGHEGISITYKKR